jgi:hypothetical protein
MSYHTNVGPKSGPLQYRDASDVSCVLKSLDGDVPAGMAKKVGWDVNRVAVWRLTVAEAELPGSWIVVDRQFRLAH